MRRRAGKGDTGEKDCGKKERREGNNDRECLTRQGEKQRGDRRERREGEEDKVDNEVA